MKKNYFKLYKKSLGFFIVIISSIFSIIVVEWCLGFFSFIEITKSEEQKIKKFVSERSTELVRCKSPEEWLKIKGMTKFLSDGGFRNKSYGIKYPDFVEVISDTRCLKSYSDSKKMRRAIPFLNNTYEINSFGYRGREWEKIKKEGKNHLFLVGGSTAFSLFANEKNSIHKKLENYLNINANESNNYKVFSAAATGIGAEREYRLLSREIIKYSPNIIVFLTGWNNASDKKAGDYYIENDNKIKQSIVKILKRLRDETYFTHTSSIILEVVDRPAHVKGLFRENVFIPNTKKSMEFCEKESLRCIFALQPTLILQNKNLSEAEKKIKTKLFHIDNKSRASTFASSYEKFKKFFLKSNFEFLDLTNLDSNNALEEIFVDAVHLTHIGNELIANELGKIILKKN